MTVHTLVTSAVNKEKQEWYASTNVLSGLSVRRLSTSFRSKLANDKSVHHSLIPEVERVLLNSRRHNLESRVLFGSGLAMGVTVHLDVCEECLEYFVRDLEKGREEGGNGGSRTGFLANVNLRFHIIINIITTNSIVKRDRSTSRYVPSRSLARCLSPVLPSLALVPCLSSHCQINRIGTEI